MMIDSIKDLYWDICFSFYFGMVEVWVMDILLIFSYVVNMVGLIQVIVYWLLMECLFKYQEKDYLLYKFNCFQVCCYGLEGVIIDLYIGDC